MILKGNNRLGIFVFFDKDGIVDDYVTYLLDDLSKSLKDLVIVCNGKLSIDGEKKLRKYSQSIHIRENVGFDVSAWKECILNILDRNYLESFDEVLLFNDTFYGPFYSFKEVFDEMNKKDIDLWALTAHGEALVPLANGKDMYIPKFLQSYFFAFRNSIVKSDDFYEFWQNIPNANQIEYNDAVNKFENKFAKAFFDKGYKYDSYIDNSLICNDKEHSICYNTFMPYGMIKDKKLPIIRRKVFNYDYESIIDNNINEEAKKALDYIKNETSYPVKLIWDNLLRLYNVRNLKTNLHLNYVLDDNYSDYKIKKNEAAVFIHLYYTDIISDSYEYIKSIPKDVDLYISTSSDEKAKYIKEYLRDLNVKKIIVVENRGRDLASLLVEFRKYILNYKYFCFVHDKKTSGGKGPVTVGRSFQFIEFENLLKSESYIKNVLKTFEENESLGLMSPPSPLHNIYFGSIGEEWTSCYDVTMDLLDRFNIKVPVSKEKTPFCLSTSFWARTEALEKLLEYNWQYDDFDPEPLAVDGTISHALERSFSYFAQDKKFYSAWCLSREYSSIEIANLDRMFSESVFIIQQKKPRYLAYSYYAFRERLKVMNYPYYRRRPPFYYSRKIIKMIKMKGLKETVKFCFNRLFKKDVD